MQASLAMAKKVVLLLVVVLGLASFVSGKQPPQILRHALEVETPMTEARYTTFMAAFSASVTSTANAVLDGHPVLRPQDLQRAPEIWLHVHLTNKAGEILVKLAFRSDNLYLAGFWNRLGGWFSFKGQEGTLPDSTRLSYTGGYADLFGERLAHKGLGFIRLNGTLALTHANTLAKFRPRYAPDTSIKDSLAFFILAVPEAQRFPQILRAVAAGLGATDKTQTIGGTLPPLAVNWARLSCALLSWAQHGRTDASWTANTEAKELAAGPLKVHTAEGDKPVDSAAKALTLLVPILRGTGCTWTPLQV